MEALPQPILDLLTRLGVDIQTVLFIGGFTFYIVEWLKGRIAVLGGWGTQLCAMIIAGLLYALMVPPATTADWLVALVIGVVMAIVTGGAHEKHNKPRQPAGTG